MNRSGRDVRVPGAAALPARLDARSARTQRALGAALVELMLAQDFDAITVQDVLDGAGVGRSTFYSHFRSKEDLLLSDAERFFTLLETHFARVAPGTMLYESALRRPHALFEPDAHGAVASTIQHSEEQAAQRATELLTRMFSMIASSSDQSRATLDSIVQNIKA